MRMSDTGTVPAAVTVKRICTCFLPSINKAAALESVMLGVAGSSKVRAEPSDICMVTLPSDVPPVFTFVVEETPLPEVFVYCVAASLVSASLVPALAAGDVVGFEEVALVAVFGAVLALPALPESAAISFTVAGAFVVLADVFVSELAKSASISSCVSCFFGFAAV